VIEGPVKIGAGTRLLHRVTLEGPLTVGADNTFYPNACVGLPPQDLKFDPSTPGAGTAIGDGNTFREGVTIHRATSDTATTIGDRNYFMANSHVGHDGRVDNDCTLVNGALLAGHVHLNDRVTIGGNGAVHQFVRLGRLVMISGTCGMAQDVPPFCVLFRTGFVGALNRVGLMRAGYGEHVNALKEAFKILYRSNQLPKKAAEQVERELGDDPLCLEMARFVLESKRGIVAFDTQRKHEKTDESGK
jgi:UDP-N-acetylglucosamine acyltransferase